MSDFYRMPDGQLIRLSAVVAIEPHKGGLFPTSVGLIPIGASLKVHFCERSISFQMETFDRAVAVADEIAGILEFRL